ncbi:MAG: hypothetical protein GF350_16540 [Chitinivibrionales bacterium]|nr:hypothetical protein [Chitinivibrionales bacterium]
MTKTVQGGYLVEAVLCEYPVVRVNAQWRAMPGIDEIGYESFSREEATLLFNLVASRYEKSSIILTTNKTFGQWGELMGDNAIATATLDRLLHHADVVIMKGESYRIKKRSQNGLIPLTMLSSAKENRK